MRARVSAALLLVAAGTAPLAAQETGAPVPETVRLDVYATALAFYSPPRGQVRWIEPAPLDAARGEAPLEREFVRALVARLGDRFLPGWEEQRGAGGRLRLSTIYPIGSSGRYRLAIGYRHHTEYHEGPASTQTFVVGCDRKGCQVLQRAPGAGPNDW